MTNTLKILGTKWALVLMLAFAVTLVVACGGDDADAEDGVAAGGAEQRDDGDDHADDGDDHADEAVTEIDDHADDGDADHEEEGGALAVEADIVIDLEMKDFAFVPARLTVKAGDVIHFNAENTTNNIHDFTIDKVDADLYIVALPGDGEHAHMDDAMADVHFAFTEAGKGAIQVRIHEPGEYVYYCSVPGHREAGMEGTIIVEAAEMAADQGGDGHDDEHAQ